MERYRIPTAFFYNTVDIGRQQCCGSESVSKVGLDPDPYPHQVIRIRILQKTLKKENTTQKRTIILFVIGFSLNYMKTIDSFVRWVFNLLFVEGLFYCFLFIISCFVSF